jgi:outer membrane biosynthesis protein TonB
MAHPGVAGLLSRRSTLAGSVSLVLHGGLLLAVALVGVRVVPAPRRIALTTVEIVSPPPAPPTPDPAPPDPPVAAPSPAPRAVARQDRAAPPQPRATAVEDLDLKVSYGARDNFAARPSADDPAEGEPGGIDSGRGIGADSRRQLEDSLAHVDLPVPQRVSLARPPREKFNYHQLRLPSVRRFAGMHIKLVLTIDAHGRVSDVELIQGADAALDLRVCKLARHFEFEPALDDDGAPVAGTSKWDIEIIDADHGQLRNSMERGYY